MTAGTRYLAGVRDVLRGRRHVYYGWWILSVGTVAMALASGLSMSSFGLYVGPLEDEFGWTRAEVSLGYSASVLTSGIAAPLVGHWVDSRGARSSIVAGGVIAALSCFLLATTESLWQFYVFYSIHAVGRQMMFFLPFQALTSRWFERRRGVALSILGSGFAIGAFIVVPIVAVMIAETGWRGSYVFAGIVIAAFFLPAGLFVVRNRPGDIGEHVDGATPAESKAGVSVTQVGTPGSMTLKQAMRRPVFWLFALGFMLLFFGMMGWQVHQIPFFEAEGMSRRTATLIVALTAVASLVARVPMGLVADRFERFEPIVVVFLGLMLASMATLLVSTTPLAIVVFVLLWVLGSSMGPLAESIILIKSFGLRHFGTILGAMLVVETAGQIVSPSLAGAIYDDTGSYDGALIMFMLAFGLGMLLFVIAARLRTPLPAREHRLDPLDPA